MKRDVIRIYLPIFRDKLRKLEDAGLGRSEEAERLRAALAFADGPANDSSAEPEYKSAA